MPFTLNRPETSWALIGTAHLVLYGALFLAAGVPVDAPVLIASGVLAIGLIAASTIDLRTAIIPDTASLGLVAAGLVSIWYFRPDEIGLHAGVALGWLLVLGLLSEGYFRWREIDGFGLGDVKLMAAAGAWLGLQGSLSVMIAACLGAIATLLGTSLLRGRGLSAQAGLPFGPFIALSIWIVWLYGSFV